MNAAPSTEILIFDSSAYTRSLLVEQLVRLSDCALYAHESWQTFDTAHINARTAIVMLNHHVSDTPPFDFLQRIKRALPDSLVVVISSPGKPHKALEALQNQQPCIDMIFDKPIDLDKINQFLTERIAAIKKQRDLNQQHLNLLRFLPTGALRRIFAKPEPGSAELFEMTVMFTDIRDSTQLILRESARNYFAKLNGILASQAQLIRSFDGMVVKTTGDGLLAVFEGAARCHLSLKCALSIQQSAQSKNTPVGIGISDGLVLTGILGTEEHFHFDVIGSHVHLAARLCAKAGQGEIVATRDVVEKARFAFQSQPNDEAVIVRGFDAPIACLNIQS
ncbi:MAG: adenylate/guanylate cyclase domain-containing protein [Gallionella sp.]